MTPVARTRHRRLSGKSKAAPAAAQNPIRSHKRVSLDEAILCSEPAWDSKTSTGTHRVAARVGASLRLEGGALTHLLDLDAEDALALGAALVGAAVDALGAALPGKLDASEWDTAAIIALAEALECRVPRQRP